MELDSVWISESPDYIKKSKTCLKHNLQKTYSNCYLGDNNEVTLQTHIALYHMEATNNWAGFTRNNKNVINLTTVRYGLVWQEINHFLEIM